MFIISKNFALQLDGPSMSSLLALILSEREKQKYKMKQQQQQQQKVREENKKVRERAHTLTSQPNTTASNVRSSLERTNKEHRDNND